ncbi:MAG TPA: peptidoglycan editing factor PgeF [Polyangiaceae bacterium LLY-WYZ-15_(1-7)]|nr:peptidoglycan editing factor PgeF [Polyangiaceae bacterium LLY-WYZ-15_(1-7)]HJL11568.1 peptidoglycan editing factor PgeF [Polyangiaceae bacterium LLY-WYZ-15_(1-7)]HJL25962.1 peptidoglycan editing factor PgeF [Polyangiaceae bacterium LLY-WYZ-15_(1-7)]HJL38164.1 peptidoglycan editing factor PgeF [Polyangiaceae bacterium LLY-WYZ-15_(1-7)]HJL50508.1 peptidoglycan editing factor PgeF [Polyangiaceae bacterium LLY-WYZ-15_(1-7)]
MADLLRSELLTRHGFAHGFALRTGGVSAPPFDSLNLGRGLGDAPDAVAENHRRLAEAVGYGRLFELSQVHGRRVRAVGAGEDPVAVRQEEGDALFATEPGVAVGVRVADCAPLLIADPGTGAVAAVHAGWRGVEARIAEAAIEALEEIGASREALLVAIGPHIRLGWFEVGEEVAERLEAVAHGVTCVDRTTGDKPHVDLTAILFAQLAALGVARARIDDLGGCTYADRSRFFSYRRDGKATGRHLAVIVARGAA